MSTSYADALSSISCDPSAMLYLDTCVFLDIVRSAVRESINSDSAKFAKSLIAKSNSTPRSLWLVTSATVEMEWNDNITDVLEEAEREILKLESRRKHFLSAANAATNRQYQHGQVESKLDLANNLKLVAESLLHACVIVTPENAHLLGAMNRVKQYLPPAKRGKAEPKDCEIYELFLGLCRDLRTRSVESDFVFSSSNTKEFGQENSGGIQPELAGIGAKYASNLAWVEAILDKRA
ncbi:PIN domain-containing protein [Idiomarina sp. HP20-50]|uniref:PIN domain-containing protein n=1 Tax=Idiomarina sp. HP20-50 TaxID=3070813 RepID=UPI00294B8A50|nr:PIN domain-containing protein [Idiomarina sp. HP20-50]MDV6315926.1 PIN domain-containing protein [Idiomarina sp. HP20-50]